MTSTRPENYPPIVDEDWLRLKNGPTVKHTGVGVYKSRSGNCDVQITRLSAGYARKGAIYRWQEETYGVTFLDGTINHQFAVATLEEARHAASSWDIHDLQYRRYTRNLVEFHGFQIEFMNQSMAIIRDELTIFQIQWVVRERRDQNDFVGSYTITVLDNRGVEVLGANKHVFRDSEIECLSAICQLIGTKICEYSGAWEHSASLELYDDLLKAILQYCAMCDLKPLPKMSRPKTTFLDKTVRGDRSIDACIDYFGRSDRSHEGWLPMGFTDEEWGSWKGAETTEKFIKRIVAARKAARTS